VNDLIADPQLPFFIEWQCEPDQHPSRGASQEVRIERLEIAGDADRVADWLSEVNGDPLVDVDVTWVLPDTDAYDAEATLGLVAVDFTTPQGTVRID
jgi:hypothetical protein